MRTYTGYWAAFMSLALAASICGCGKNEQASTTTKSTNNIPLPEPPLVATCEPGIPGGRLVMAEFADPKSFNPITENEASTRDIIRFLFAGLVSFDWPSQGVTPGLAASWSVESDQKTWTFNLRHGLLWSDGQPLTADDVVFTWQVIYNTNIINSIVDLFRVGGKDFVVTKIDDYTVKVVTPGVYAPFLESFGGVPIVPKHKLEQAVKEGRFAAAYGVDTAPEEVVGSGPFRLKAFKPAQYTQMERNPYFCEVDKKGQRLPYLDNIIYTVVPNQNAISLRFLKGECDVNERVMPDEYDRYQEEAKKGKISVSDLGVGPETLFLWFNQNTGSDEKTSKPFVEAKKLKWFRNQKFRQAVSYAIDRQSIVNSIYAGRAKPNFGCITVANTKWVNPNVMQYPYDLVKAHALLAEMGIKDRDADGYLKDADGNTIEFVFHTNTGNDIRGKTAVLLLADFKKLGFKVSYQPLEFNSLVQKIDFSFDYDCILLGLTAGGVDPADSMNVMKSSGFTHQWFPREKTPSTEWEAQIDKLMDAQISTLDFPERKKDFDQVQAILSEQVPMIYTVVPISYVAIRSDIANVRATVLPYYRLTWNAEELYFKKK